MAASIRNIHASTRLQKRATYDASIAIDSDDDIMNVEDDEGEEDDGSDAEFYAPTKRNKRQASKSSKRQKRSTAAEAKSKSFAFIDSNIDDIENFVENPIFKSLSSDDLTPTDLAQSWFDDFMTMNLNTKFDALNDFLNFILRCSGCVVQLSRHDVTNSENAKETVTEIQRMFARQKYHEFPMKYIPNSANKDWKDFPNRALSFISSIILIAGESGVLYEDDGQFIQLLLEWIGAMSTSNIRALRYVSTVFGLNIQSILCKLSINISTFIDKFLRQLKRENESLKSLIDNKERNSKKQLARQIDSTNERIKVIENNVEMYKKQKKTTDNYINDFFNTLFVHRYRDVASEIRFKCVSYLGDWMEDYPEMFFESTYLRYLGWLLTDQDSNIRSEVFKVLIKLYKKRVTVSALRQFTSYFKNKLIEIVIYESDFNTRLNCLQLLNEVINKGYLDDGDNIQITSLIFIDNEDIIYPSFRSKLNPNKFLKEISKFILKVEHNFFNGLMENHEIAIESINRELSFDIRTILKIRSLLQILLDSYEFYLNKYSTNIEIKKSLENSKINKFSRIFQFIYQLKEFNNNNENFELILNYINFDFTALEISDDLKDNIELDSKLQYLLLILIDSATTIYLEGSENQFFKSLFPQPNKFKSSTLSIEKDNKFYISKLLLKLPEICNYFHDDIEKIGILISLVSSLMNSKNDFNNSNELRDSVSQLLRIFTVINFPLCYLKIENSKFWDSITYQYIQFFSNLNIENLNLNSEIELIFNELTITLNSKIKEKSNSILDYINKFNILSNNKFILNRILKELSSSLSLCSESLYLTIENDSRYISETESVPVSLKDSDILSFLKITNSFINKSLEFIFNGKDGHKESNNTKLIFNSINIIQRVLSLLILPDHDDLKMDTIHNISLFYLDNLMCISAFKAEYYNLSNNDEAETDNLLISLRSYVGKSIQTQLLKLFCIREFQYAELMKVNSEIERDALEDVNFTNYIIEIAEDEDEEKIKQKYEYLLCEITSKLILCCKLNIITDSEDEGKLIIARILKNSHLLGNLFNKILDSIGVLISVDNDDENNSKKSKKQSIITDLKNVKKRKLIENSDDEKSEEEEENDIDNDSMNLGGEDEDDPIENSDDDSGNDNNDKTTNISQRDDEIEFSDIDEDDDQDEVENDNTVIDRTNNRPITNSSEISSFSSSFPFTQ